jgi:hypothetical protein
VSRAKNVDWRPIEDAYRVGLRSLRHIADEHGVAPSAILKHCNKFGITRDLKARIAAATQAKVNAAAVNAASEQRKAHSTKAGLVAREGEVIEASAAQAAAVQIGQKRMIGDGIDLCKSMLAELRATHACPDAYAMVHLALDEPDEQALEALRDMARLVQSLPQRLSMLKQISDAMHKFVGMQREAHGLDTASGTDGRPLVVIRDYTGRGDVDSPARGGGDDEGGAT